MQRPTNTTHFSQRPRAAGKRRLRFRPLNTTTWRSDSAGDEARPPSLRKIISQENRQARAEQSEAPLYTVARPLEQIQAQEVQRQKVMAIVDRRKALAKKIKAKREEEAEAAARLLESERSTREKSRHSSNNGGDAANVQRPTRRQKKQRPMPSEAIILSEFIPTRYFVERDDTYLPSTFRHGGA